MLFKEAKSYENIELKLCISRDKVYILIETRNVLPSIYNVLYLHNKKTPKECFPDVPITEMTSNMIY